MITSCPADFLTGRKKKGTSFFAQFQTGGSIKNAMKGTVTGLQTSRVEPPEIFAGRTIKSFNVQQFF